MTLARRLAVALTVGAAFGFPGCGLERAQQDLEPHVADVGAQGSDPETDARPAIVFLGTSLTAGYGLNDPDSAFPARIQTLIDQSDLEFRVVNAGVSGDTSAGGLARLEWVLRTPVRVLVLELGANDGLRGLDVDALAKNLTAIIERTQARYPDAAIVIAGMQAPPNLGPRYTDQFRSVYAGLADRFGATLIPFLLEGVAADPALNQADGIHPTSAGHREVAKLVWRALEPVLMRLD